MRSREIKIKENILDTLTKHGTLGYSQLYVKATKVKDEKTFQKYLFQLIKDRFVRKRKSKENKKSTFYSIRGLEFSSLNISLKDNDMLLTDLQNNLYHTIETYLEYKTISTNSKNLQNSRLIMVKQIAKSMNFIFELSNTVLFLKLADNIPVLRKTENPYKTQLSLLQKNLTFLRKHDLKTFKQTMAVAVLKSGISIPGLI